MSERGGGGSEQFGKGSEFAGKGRGSVVTDDDVSTQADSRSVRMPSSTTKKSKNHLGSQLAQSLRESADMVAENIEHGYGVVAGGSSGQESKATEFVDSDASRGGGAYTSDYQMAGHPRADMSDSSSSDFGPETRQAPKQTFAQGCWRGLLFVFLVLLMILPCICIGTGIFCLACRNSGDATRKVVPGYSCDKGKPTMTIFGYVLIGVGFILVTSYCFVCCCRRQNDAYLIEQDEDEYEEERRALNSRATGRMAA
mmetsp:Transcript_1863/g.4293  ORF Transcript_1863/g.4293 Transcript_1863/m.4293 type:complete len:255 (+) Transcript_1863:160-924(+)|eukprot:CAMPEP_0178996472 /NCGR_PEP_ID=MMETSP0795-20121207/8384_1 /TAXON_ID=88552 /ORGANISM="Amoebophrya sp., Strain Ameob2" /LENGTH=254 /DNA_ID=CAMNT_0020688859 /DNA_START=73 /DNA_END=837 /DNA_ORIENTATION=+